ncbi:ABC transporter ATP-binding protein [Clostridium botulinum A1 str. CFSAN002368]|nr:ABC transporter ATP-binding protein [Clostridium botulinum A1 str. CFSAN002368]
MKKHEIVYEMQFVNACKAYEDKIISRI